MFLEKSCRERVLCDVSRGAMLFSEYLGLGVAPAPVFSWLSPATFVWSAAPLSHITAPLSAGVVYVLLVLGLNVYMTRVRSGRGIETKKLQAVHNLILSVGSLVMLLGSLRELLIRAANEPSSGAYGKATFLFCEPRGAPPDGPLYYWSYVYYLSKYYELLDTVLQLCKGRPPPHFFLHVYHHAVVLLMAWLWLETSQTLHFLGLLFNTAVHVLMYYYYFRRVLGLPTPWKRYVTQFQIIQFGTSLLCYLATLKLLFIDGAECSGSRAMVFNLVFNVTLLYQFVGVLTKGSKAK